MALDRVRNADGWMNDELERMWKEVMRASSRHCTGIWPEGLRNATKISGRITSVQVEIRTGHLQNTNVERFLNIILSGVSPLGTVAATGLFYQPRMIDDGDCGAFGGMKYGRGNRSTRRKPAPAPLCPPQIPHDQTRVRPRTVAVGSQRLTA
jgi:hypothetical protein